MTSVKTSVTTRSSILLASQSPVRRALLARAGVDFAVEASAVDESEIKQSFFGASDDKTPLSERLDRAREAAAELAWLKAVRVAQRFAGARVIGADQIFISSNHAKPLSKPKDREEARTQLRSLRGAEATLITAAVVVRAEVSTEASTEADGTPQRLWGTIEAPRAVFRKFDTDEADRVWHLQGDDSLHAAGSCCLEGAGIQLLARLEGDLFSFLGLPLIPLLNFLRSEGLNQAQE